MKAKREAWEYVNEKGIDDKEWLRRYIEYLGANCYSSGRKQIISRLEDIYGFEWVIKDS